MNHSMTNTKDTIKTINAATSLLISIAYADEVLDNREISVIKEIISEFFEIEPKVAEKVYIDSSKDLENSTDLFAFGKVLNNTFSYQDKLDFIGCIFEVAFIDGELHYIESHTIKSIANILNLDHSDIIKTKMEIKRFL